MPSISTRIATTMPPLGLDAITAITDGFKIYQVVVSAIEVGLFAWLETHGPQPLAACTNRLGLRGMYIPSFLRTLVDAGLLELDGELYRLTSAARAFLSPEAEWYQGWEIVALADPRSPWSRFSGLLSRQQVESLRPDTHVVDRLRVQHLLHGEAQAIVKSVQERPEFATAKSLLDLGGSGVHAIALCQMNPDLCATVVVTPADMAVCQNFIIETGLSERIDIHMGDPLNSELGMGHDIILAAHAFYGMQRQLDTVLQSVGKSLRPGGILATCHWFSHEDGADAAAGIREIDRCVTAGGYHSLCQIEQFQQILLAAGFVDVKQSDVQGLYGPSKLHIAKRETRAARRAGPRMSRRS